MNTTLGTRGDLGVSFIEEIQRAFWIIFSGDECKGVKRVSTNLHFSLHENDWA